MLLPTEILIKKLALITTNTRLARVQRGASRATTAGMRERKRPDEKLDKCILINAPSAFASSRVLRAEVDEGCLKDKRILIALLPRISANPTGFSSFLRVSVS